MMRVDIWVEKNIFKHLKFFQINFWMKIRLIVTGWCISSKVKSSSVIFRYNSNQKKLVFFQKSINQVLKTSKSTTLKRCWLAKQWKYSSVSTQRMKWVAAWKLLEAWANFMLTCAFILMKGPINVRYAQFSSLKKEI